MKKMMFFVLCTFIVTGCDFIHVINEEDSTNFIVECDSFAIVTPSKITEPKGSTVIFDVTIEKDCYIDQITVDGKNITVPSDNKFSVVASTPNCQIKVMCKRNIASNKFTVLASAREGGTISPSGTSFVEVGKSVTFSFNPNFGFEVNEIKVNGNVIANASFYTFVPDRDSSTISVSFNKTQLGLLTQKPWKNILFQSRAAGTNVWYQGTDEYEFHTVYSFDKEYRFEHFYENGKRFSDGPYVLTKDSLLVGVYNQYQIGGIRSRIVTLTEDSLVLVHVSRYIGPESDRVPDTEFKQTYTH